VVFSSRTKISFGRRASFIRRTLACYIFFDNTKIHKKKIHYKYVICSKKNLLKIHLGENENRKKKKFNLSSILKKEKESVSNKI